MTRADILRAWRKERLRRVALYSPYEKSRVVKFTPTTDNPNYPTRTWHPNLGPASQQQYLRNTPAVESLRPHNIAPTIPYPTFIYHPGKDPSSTFDPGRQQREVSQGQDGKSMNTQIIGDPTNPQLFKEDFPTQPVRKLRKLEDEEEDES